MRYHARQWLPDAGGKSLQYMKRRLPSVTTLLFAGASIVAVACDNTGPGAGRPIQDTASAEGWNADALATADTYRIRARRVMPCARLPMPPASWVSHSLPGLLGATLRTPPELEESFDTEPNSAIASEFTTKGAMVQVMFSPHGDGSPGTVPTGCGTRVAGFETPLYLYQSRQGRALDSVFSAQVTFALPDTFGVFIAISTRSRGARDSLLGVLTSLAVPSRAARRE